MSARPRLSKLSLWPTRERECLELLALALAELAANPGPDTDEDSINRRLMRFLDAAIYRSAYELAPVVYEGRSSPAPSDAVRASREFKRPDFAWLWTDDLAADRMLSRREFVVECKRLGAEPFPTRYVVDGILRFINLSHAYGKDMRSGAMVGYMQSILVDDAMKRVNAVASNRGVPSLTLRERRGDDEAKLEHQLLRAFAVSPFSLTHLWVQLA
jgi:hypothetical protein